MGIAVDIWGSDILMTYIGEPAELNYTFDPAQARRHAGQPGGVRAADVLRVPGLGHRACRCRT